MASTRNISNSSSSDIYNCLVLLEVCNVRSKTSSLCVSRVRLASYIPFRNNTFWNLWIHHHYHTFRVKNHGHWLLKSVAKTVTSLLLSFFSDGLADPRPRSPPAPLRSPNRLTPIMWEDSKWLCLYSTGSRPNLAWFCPNSLVASSTSIKQVRDRS